MCSQSCPRDVPALASTVEHPQGIIGVGPGSAPAVPSALRDHGLGHIRGHVTDLWGTGDTISTQALGLSQSQPSQLENPRGNRDKCQREGQIRERKMGIKNNENMGKTATNDTAQY